MVVVKVPVVVVVMVVVIVYTYNQTNTRLCYRFWHMVVTTMLVDMVVLDVVEVLFQSTDAIRDVHHYGGTGSGSGVATSHW